MRNSRNRTVISKLWVLSAGLITAVVAVGGIGMWSTLQLAKALDATSKVSLPAVRNMTLLDMMHDGIRANVFHAIIVSGSKDANEVNDVRVEAKEFDKDIHAYTTYLDGLGLSSPIKRQIEVAKPKIDAYVNLAAEIVAIALDGRVELAIEKMPDFQVKFKELEADLETLGDMIEKEASANNEKSDATVANVIELSLILVLLASFVGFAFSFFVIRSLRRSMLSVISALSSESQTVANSAGTLQEAATSLASSTTQQASALQQTAASIDEITAMVKKTGENAKNLEVTTQHSQGSASKGQGAITQMLSSIESISDSYGKIVLQVDDSNKKITEIVRVIGEIGNKTKVINDIVFQTKLLSFNASVEAARAGEHGKGFAVVAEEVGNLAQMSGNAAKEISDMLSSSIEKVESIVNDSKRQVEHLIVDGKKKIDLGAQVAKDCGNALEEIVKYSSDVGMMVGEISTAIGEQNQGILEISKAIQLLDQATHEISSTSKSSSATSSNLRDQSDTLLEIVDSVRSLITHESSPLKKNSIAAPSSISAPEDRPNFRIVDLNRSKSAHAPRKVSSAKTPLESGFKQAVGSAQAPSENDPRFEDV